VRTELIEVGGRRTELVVGGEGPPLLYLHSFLGEPVGPSELLSGLAETRTVYAPLHPGFGRSLGLEAVRGIDDLTDHYLAFIDAHGWGRVDVVGCSLGGWIALELAARHGDRIGRLVLAASLGIRLAAVPMADIFVVQLGQERRARELLFHDPDHPVAALAVPRFAELDDERFRLLVKAAAATARVGWNPYLHDPRLERLLPRVVSAPLVVWGSNDRVVPPAYGERLAQLLPGARLELIPDCGHAIWLERPRALLAAAREHLDRPELAPTLAAEHEGALASAALR